jgi:hypothetical protein
MDADAFTPGAQGPGAKNRVAQYLSGDYQYHWTFHNHIFFSARSEYFYEVKMYRGSCTSAPFDTPRKLGTQGERKRCFHATRLPAAPRTRA